MDGLMDRFSQACKDFAFTIGLKGTKVLGQAVVTLPVISNDNYKFEMVHQFTYLGSTISNNLSLDSEIKEVSLNLLLRSTSTLARLQQH